MAPPDAPAPRIAIAVVLFAVVVAAVYAAFAPLRIVGDEGCHSSQVRTFARGEFAIRQCLTTVPSIHLAFAAVSRATGAAGTMLYRALVAAMAVGMIALAGDAMRRRGVTSVRLRMLQIGLVPIVLPLCSLFYTDVPSLFFLVVAVHGMVRGNYSQAALGAIACMAVRQNAVVWFAFVALWSAAAVLSQRPEGTSRWQLLARYKLPIALFAMGGLAFAVFLVRNQGIAIGDREAHPFPSFSVGNVFFSLFVAFWCLLPLMVAGVRRAVAREGKRLRLIVVVALAFPLYWNFFNITHNYNVSSYASSTVLFLRNAILDWLVESETNSLLAFVPMAVAMVGLFGIRFRERRDRLVHPFAVLSLVPAMLIEQRYVLPALVVFLILRQSESTAVEAWTLAWEAPLAAAVVALTATGGYFL